MVKNTTIQISQETKNHLDQLKLSKHETYNDVIGILIEDNYGLSEMAIKDLNEALEDVRTRQVVDHSEVKKMFGIE